MILFNLDNTTETKESYSILAKKFGCKDFDNEKDYDFQANNPFENKTDEDLKEIVFLAHSNTTEVGEYDAKNFVRRLSRLFERNGKNKNRLKHIKFVSCRVGEKDNEGNSLARAIVNELYKNGFHNVKVHAVAIPSSSVEGTEIVVKVYPPHWTSVGRVLGRGPGYVIGHYLTPEHKAKLAQLEKEYKPAKEQASDNKKGKGNKVKKEQKKEKLTTSKTTADMIARFEARRKKREEQKELNPKGEYQLNPLEKFILELETEHAFFGSDDPRFDLRRPKNTFIPDEVQEKREIDQEKENSLEAILSRIDKLEKVLKENKEIEDEKRDKKIAQVIALKTLYVNIQDHEASDWKRLVEETKKDISKDCSGRFGVLVGKSSTVELLRKIIKGKFASNNNSKIVDKKNNKEEVHSHHKTESKQPEVGAGQIISVQQQVIQENIDVLKTEIKNKFSIFLKSKSAVIRFFNIYPYNTQTKQLLSQISKAKTMRELRKCLENRYDLVTENYNPEAPLREDKNDRWAFYGKQQTPNPFVKALVESINDINKEIPKKER